MKSFPNAAKGLKLIMVGAFLTMVATIVLNLYNFGLFSGSAAELIVFLVLMLFLLISEILELVGLAKAGKDHTGYRNALIINIVAIILEILASIFESTLSKSIPNLDFVMNTVARFASLAVVIYVLFYTSALLRQIDKNELADRGMTVLWIYTIISIISSAVSGVSSLDAIEVATGLTLAIIGGVLTVVYTFMYFAFLSRSCVALNNGK